MRTAACRAEPAAHMATPATGATPDRPDALCPMPGCPMPRYPAATLTRDEARSCIHVRIASRCAAHESAVRCTTNAV